MWFGTRPMEIPTQYQTPCTETLIIPRFLFTFINMPLSIPISISISFSILSSHFRFSFSVSCSFSLIMILFSFVMFIIEIFGCYSSDFIDWHHLKIIHVSLYSHIISFHCPAFRFISFHPQFSILNSQFSSSPCISISTVYCSSVVSNIEIFGCCSSHFTSFYHSISFHVIACHLVSFWRSSIYQSFHWHCESSKHIQMIVWFKMKLMISLHYDFLRMNEWMNEWRMFEERWEMWDDIFEWYHFVSNHIDSNWKLKENLNDWSGKNMETKRNENKTKTSQDGIEPSPNACEALVLTTRLLRLSSFQQFSSLSSQLLAQSHTVTTTSLRTLPFLLHSQFSMFIFIFSVIVLRLSQFILPVHHWHFRVFPFWFDFLASLEYHSCFLPFTHHFILFHLIPMCFLTFCPIHLRDRLIKDWLVPNSFLLTICWQDLVWKLILIFELTICDVQLLEALVQRNCVLQFSFGKDEWLDRILVAQLIIWNLHQTKVLLKNNLSIQFSFCMVMVFRKRLGKVRDICALQLLRTISERRCDLVFLCYRAVFADLIFTNPENCLIGRQNGF
jgi:hypothetical protein